MILYRFSQAPMHASCYILLDEKTNRGILFDPCVTPEYVFSRLGRDTKITHILITHGHFDHINMLDAWKDACFSEVLISREDSLLLKSPQMNASSYFMGFGEVICQTKPDILLEGDEMLMLGGINVNVFPAPGHTSGGLLFLAENFLFSGDTLFDRGYGRYDLYGGDCKELRKTLLAMQQFKGRGLKLCPGHGEECDFDRAYITI